MRFGPSLVRWPVCVALAALFSTSPVESIDPECAAPGVTNELTVNSSSGAATLHTLLGSCEGGVFDVSWHGRVSTDKTFTVVNGTSLNITGVLGPSNSTPSSSDESDADDSAGTSAIEGHPFDPLFNVYYGGTVTLHSLVLDGNDMERSSMYGGAIYAYTDHDETSETSELLSPATVNIIDCTFLNHTVSDYGYGGAIFCEKCELNIFGTTFTTNYDPSASIYEIPLRGGAIYSAYSAVHIGGGTTFTDSWAYEGGAIYSAHSELHIEGGTTFTDNWASAGGAIFSEYSELQIDGGIAFANNSAQSGGGTGGAIHSEYSDLHIEGDVTFTNNSVVLSSTGGGAIYSLDDKLNISGNAVFSGNFAQQAGGAIAVVGPLNLSIVGATFTSNWVDHGYTMPGGGGALWVDSVGEIGHYLENLAFDNNSAASDGGALFLSTPSGNTFIRSSTFHRNVAEISGGALFHHAGKVFLSDANFTGNMAGSEGLAAVTYGELDAYTGFFAENNSFYCPLGQFAFDKPRTEDFLFYRRGPTVCSRCSSAWSLDMGEEEEPVCEDLPTGVKALSSGTTVSNLYLEKGYYRVSAESRSIPECYNEDACVGGDTVGQYCAPGYQGPSCTVCADTYAPGLGFSCHKCEGTSGESAMAIGGFVVAVVVVITAFILLDLARRIDGEGVDDEGIGRAEEAEARTCKRGLDWVLSIIAKSFPLTAFKTVIVVWQIVSQFAAIAGDTYPDVYDDFISTLSFINVDIGFFVSSSCVVRTNFYHRLLFATITPLVILLVLRVTYHIAKKRNENSPRALLAVKEKHLKAGLFIAFFIYSSVSYTIFQTFVCDTLDDGVSYLRADYSLTCSGKEHSYYVVFAAAMVFVYPIGIPLFCWNWMRGNREELQRVDRDSVARLKPFQGIWASYKPSRYYYEIIEFGRRITLTVVAVFVLPGSSAQIAVVLLLAVVFLFVSESLSPFGKSIDMGLYRWGNGIVLGSMYVALLLKYDVSQEEDGALSAFAGVLVAANVFMVAAVIVQTYLMVKEWRRGDKPIESPDPVVSSALSKQASCLQDEVGGAGAAPRPRSPLSAGVSAEPEHTT